MNADRLFTVGELSKICKLPITTLRYYDKIGVLKPVYVDEDSNYRYYDEDSIVTATLLYSYRFYGCSLKNVKSLLERGNLKELHSLFKTKIKEFDEQIRVARMSKDYFSAWVDLLEEAETVLERKQQPVCIRELCVSDLMCWQPQIMPYTKLKHILVYTEGICDDSPLVYTYGPLYNHFSSYQSRLKNDFRRITSYIGRCPLDNNHLERHEIREPSVVASYHVGGFNSISKTYEKMLDWVKQHNFELRGDCIERYVTDFWSSSREELYVTEIFLPLKSVF